MADDILVSKKSLNFFYGENSNSEDFAESIAEYIQNSLSFKQQFQTVQRLSKSSSKCEGGYLMATYKRINEKTLTAAIIRKFLPE